jgi:hypothetical protein
MKENKNFNLFLFGELFMKFKKSRLIAQTRLKIQKTTTTTTTTFI